ncbi:MAG: DUF5671 domain-containing protein [Ornithinimicrobium sp.]|uniref:DUF5671 domain-containing protein n=1 Tax=Ornithinimicrobium sp. TaxID=1977084 RepID=UPI0026E00F5D|nr:DUF5671 domain-containing protein [Ornithinimicrobium sp.]MDO5739968.1 DUF5671 domain-containing protein [Ornithinimicrobium sp.]
MRSVGFVAVLAFVLLALVVVGIGAGIRYVHQRGNNPEPAGSDLSTHSVRRFFQYVILAGLLFAAASGVSGLLGRLFEMRQVMVRDDTFLALQLTFTFIALPLWGALLWWTLRAFRRDPAEVRAFTWAAYLLIVELTSLIIAMYAWQQTLSMAAQLEPYRGSPIAQAVVWTLIWAAHRWWGRRSTPPSHQRVQQLLGSLIGLATAATGLIGLLTPALRELFGLSGEVIVSASSSEVLAAAIAFVIGAAVWILYWALDAVRSPRTTPWLAYVLLAGVGGGLIVAITAASALVYAVLVWLVGVPTEASAVQHFDAAPAQLAYVAVGLLTWWYHREVLESGIDPEVVGSTTDPEVHESTTVPDAALAPRTEVRRVYEYLMSAIGLLAAAAGLVMIIVTLIEVISAGSDLLAGGHPVNTLIAALVLLAVGLPVWWWHWRQAQRARDRDPARELDSPARRTYLLILFGVMGITAVIALITLVFFVIDDTLSGSVDTETIRRIRYPIGILAATSLLSAYHWTIFGSDRAEQARRLPEAEGATAGTVVVGGVTSDDVTSESTPAAIAAPAPRVGTLLLVGPSDPQLRAVLQEATGRDVQLVHRTDVGAAPWPVEELLSLVAASPAKDLLVLAEPEGLRLIPIER